MANVNDLNVTRNVTLVGGRYAIYGEIACGGMATIHHGRFLGHLGFSRPVAIKRLHPLFGRDEKGRSMIIDEARLAARVQHPNVVQTLDLIEDGANLLLVMEYIRGETLGTLLSTCRRRGEQVPVRIALAVMTDLLNGLHAAHEATTEDEKPLHLVHRDVSSQNVIVGIDGVARVLDFGIARAAVRLESTRDGIVKGKLSYMAPEQLLGSGVTRQADIFSAGVVLWELLTGHRLFLAGTECDESVLMARLLASEIEPPSRVRKDIDPRIEAIAMRALQRDAPLRQASAREMAQALEQVGPVATQIEVSEWIQRVASESLSARAEHLSMYQRSSADLEAVAGEKAVALTDLASGSRTRSTRSRDPQVTSRSHPAWPLPQSRRPGTMTALAIGLALAMASASLVAAIRSSALVAYIKTCPSGP